jgi:hypothetical protein
VEPMIRGYSVKQQLNFLETQYEPALSEQLLNRIPADVRKTLSDIKPAEWYPRRHSVELLRAIASHRGNDEQAVKDDLVRCGTFIATEASNTFLKILMKMLTPALFAKKIPDFWQRDQRGGHIEVGTSDANKGRMQLRLRDVEGFDHIAIISIGWMIFGMTAMGKTDVQVTQQGWSLQTPGPREVTYDLKWS